MKSFHRRDFLKLLGVAGLSAFTPFPRSLARAQSVDPYDGPLFITIAAGGGWDPTSFCDPKVNIPGEPEISQWARTGVVQTIASSPITYAPFANNATFFTRFHGDMLVLNGVDTETNSHDTGVRNNWSGRVPPGYPSFSALAAAALGADLPLPYLTNAGYRETGGLSTYTELSSARDLQDLVDPNRVPDRDDRFYHDADELASGDAPAAAASTSGAARETVSFEGAFDAEAREEFGDLGPGNERPGGNSGGDRPRGGGGGGDRGGDRGGNGGYRGDRPRGGGDRDRGGRGRREGRADRDPGHND